jgi:hypothetical protein
MESMATYLKGCLALRHKMKPLTTESNGIGSRNPFRQCRSLIYVMNASARSFAEINRKYTRKLCGNCAHVEFALTKEERAFLIKMVGTHSSDVIWGSWIPQKGNVKKVGASQQLDPEKLRFVKTLMTHISYCPREKAWVSFIDQDCFRWQPRSVFKW